MKKVYFLIVLAFGFGLALSGCAKPGTGITYHSYRYYKKHRAEAKAVYAACSKIPRKIFHTEKYQLSKNFENCMNAEDVVRHEGNIFQKSLFNALRKGERP